MPRTTTTETCNLLRNQIREALSALSIEVEHAALLGDESHKAAVKAKKLAVGLSQKLTLLESAVERLTRKSGS